MAKRGASRTVPAGAPPAPRREVSARLAARTGVALLLGAELALTALFWPLLEKLGLRTCCFADWEGFKEMALDWTPGGALHWCGDFFGALWAAPWLGGGAFVALALAVAALGWRWARLPWWAALAPFGLVLWHVAFCGFSVWLFQIPAMPALYLLGWGAVFFLFGLYRRHGGAGSLAAALLFPACGVPAAAGALLGATLPGVSARRRACRAALALAALPLWRFGCPADPNWRFLFVAHSSVLAEPGAFWWNALQAATLALAACAAWREAFVLPERVLPWLRRAGAVLPAATLLAAVWLASDPLHPLCDILACERALERGDMKRILAVPPERAVAHRMLSAYTIYALWRTGALEERLFAYPWQVSHEKSAIDTMELDGYRLTFHYGLALLARRWCYESVINKGWTPDKLRLMAHVALIGDEPPLAERYALQLRRLPFRRAEADHLLALAAGAAPDPEADAGLLRANNLCRRLSKDEGCPVFEGDKRLEPGIYNRYSVLKNGDREMVLLYLCASLLRKDALPFAENLAVILKAWPKRPLPLVFQQAYLDLAGNPPMPNLRLDLSADLFDPAVVAAYNDFVRLAPDAKPGDKAFIRRFGGTYWFYKNFVP